MRTFNFSDIGYTLSVHIDNQGLPRDRPDAFALIDNAQLLIRILIYANIVYISSLYFESAGGPHEICRIPQRGKDGMLALHEMVKAGHKPVAPLVMYRREAGRGWVHGIACRHRRSLAVFGDDGYPYAVPLSYVYDNGTLYFHCAKSGHKSDAIRVCDLEAKPCSMALCQDIKKAGTFQW